MKRNLIVNFHVVNNSAWFEKVVLLLKSKYTLVDLSFLENYKNNEKKKSFCHITFDDGDETFYSVAFPILKKYDVPATIFVSPKSIIQQENFWFQEVKGYDNHIMMNILARDDISSQKTKKELSFMSVLMSLSLDDINKIISSYQKQTNVPPKKFQNMNLDQIHEVERSGLITIGAHTLNHPILKNESNERCDREITGSITELQKLLGHEVKYFAYPNGIPNVDFGEREINCLKKNNITIAVSTEVKFISKHDNRLALPRVGLSYGSMRFIKIKLMLGSKWMVIKSLLRPKELINRKAYSH